MLSEDQIGAMSDSNGSDEDTSHAEELLDAAKWIKRIQDANGNGEYLRAADHAENALELLGKNLSPQDRATLHYDFVLAVARSGATDRANELYEKYKIGANSDVDSQALRARILKQQSYEQPARKRKKALRRAAAAYEDVYTQTEDSFPAVNASTLYRLAGDIAKAHELAKKTLTACESMGDSYWKVATIAEAALVLGDIETSQQYLDRAAGFKETTPHAALASTRKQLKLLCQETGQDMAILSSIALPEILFFAGHIIAAPGKPGRFPADQEQTVGSEIQDYFDTRDIGFAFGSLASGGDLLIAEECIRRDIELHVVLPFDRDDFLEVSVLPSGNNWGERFETVYAHIQAREQQDRGSITYATEGGYLGDDSLFKYCADFAMGLAMVRARNLDADIRMLAIYDGKGGPGFGTDKNLEHWQKFGLPADIISPVGVANPPRRESAQARKFPPRELRAILFGDVKGFSKLKEEMLPPFNSRYMSRLSRVLKSFGNKVLYSNSWGDAIYVVLKDPVSAALCGLELQRATKQMNFAALGIEPDLSLRLSAHYGPVFRGKDYIRNEPTYFGSQVTKAARIEPITPPGEIYLTEAMAAALALSGTTQIECNYMGNLPTSKKYGNLRMYVLKFNG